MSYGASVSTGTVGKPKTFEETLLRIALCSLVLNLFNFLSSHFCMAGIGVLPLW